MRHLLQASDLSYAFGSTPALAGVSAAIDAGEVVAVMGPSGSGKSTLLHCLAGILVPQSGSVVLDGTDLTALSDGERSKLRLRRFGFVFQFGDLIPELTLRENVELPLRLTGCRRAAAARRARELLAQLGIEQVADRRAGSVSGGQAQRAAAARALAAEPAVIFADEPTGSLDTVTGEAVLSALLDLARDQSSGVVIVTHDHRVAAYADREVILRDGRVASPSAAPVMALP